MTINEFLNTYLDKVELFKEPATNPGPFCNTKILNRPSKIDITSALLTAESIQEFEFTIKVLAESYDIKLTGHVNEAIYRAKLSLLKVYLTRLLFSEKNAKKADSYLKILEKRFKESWNDKYQKTESNTDNEIKISFEVVENEYNKSAI